jgi:hypothetical protein
MAASRRQIDVRYASIVKRTAAPRLTFVVTVLVALSAIGAGSSSARVATDGHQRTVYTVASAVQFLNSADDLARGKVNNPFNSATNKLSPKATEGSGQTLPGDVALFSFKLYANAALTKGDGTATYTCYFNYAKSALCQAYYEFNGGGGTVVSAGPVDFDKQGFSMVVTGGTKNYLGARGEVTAVPAAKNAQRVALTLLN